jgi:tetratricopeptide (TPR) repeat protein
MLDRPFYFTVVFWGERFRNYFLDLCLPTLLSPGNLPALATAQRSKFLIWTRPDDWAAMKASPIFRLLEQYVDPVFGAIPPCPVGTSPCVHMGFGQRRGLEMAYEAKAYPFVLQPDSMFSDGMVGRLQELAIEGVELALVPALRFAEEPFFDNLQKLGISPRDRNGAAEPISLSSRQLVSIALASMHSETMTYEWDAPYFTPTPSAVWWRVPGEDGIVVHCMSWGAPLLDFAAVPMHDTSTFDQGTIDADYVYKNLGDIKKIHLVLDSDEMFIASWAPLSDKAYDLTPQPALQQKLTGDLTRKERFCDWFYSGVFDHLKQETFFQAARWHARPINENWRPVEEHALETLLSCVAPPRSQYSELRDQLSRGEAAAAITLLDDMLANDRGNAHYLFLRAAAYTVLDQDDKAEADLTEALDVLPGDDPPKANIDRLLLKRAAIRMKRKDFAGAIADYGVAAEIAPEDKEILTSLGDARFAAGDAKNALADYEHALALGPPTPAQYFRIWQARSAIGDYSGAVAAASKAVELDPKNADLYYCLGSSYFSLKRYDAVIEELSKALAINPKKEILTSLGDARFAAGDAKNALADYEHALALGPPTPAQYFRIWQARFAIGDYSGAVAAASKAVELDPKNADLYYCLGSSYFSLKRYDESFEELSKALAINPEVEPALSLRAAVIVLRAATEPAPFYIRLRNISSQHDSIYYLLPHALFRRASLVGSLWASRSIILHRVGQILRGDRTAWKRAKWRFRQSIYQISGLEFKEREPS